MGLTCSEGKRTDVCHGGLPRWVKGAQRQGDEEQNDEGATKGGKGGDKKGGKGATKGR